MYQLGKKAYGKGKTIIALSVVVLLLLGVATVALSRQYFKSNSTVKQSPGVIRHVDVVQPKKRTVSNNMFTLELAASWKESTNNMLTPPADYGWSGTDDESARRLDIFVDDIPADRPVNRLLPVTANGNRLLFSGGDLSDNCVNFTDANKESKATGQTLAKWSGVAFYCDMGNSLRNLVGIGSEGSINSVALDGRNSGRHKFFFIYTDHSASPSYEAFYNILNSFKVK